MAAVTRSQGFRPIQVHTILHCGATAYHQGSGIYCVYPSPDDPTRLLFDAHADGRPDTRSGRIIFEGQNKFRLEDDQASNGDLCTVRAEIFGDEIINCNFKCQSGWTSGAGWFRVDPANCVRMGLQGTNAVPQTLPSYPPVSGLGSWWMVYGAEGWLATWTRRGQSDVFDGLWRRGNEQVRTVVRIERLANLVTITRLESEDGLHCVFDGRIEGAQVKGGGRCTPPGQSPHAPFAFRATMHE